MICLLHCPAGFDCGRFDSCHSPSRSYIAPTMSQLLRRCVIFFLALTFSVTSVGWAMASTSIAPRFGDEHHGSVDAGLSSESHQHGREAVDQIADCLGSDDCTSDVHHDGLGDSCCAMACHDAASPSTGAAIFVAIIRAMDPVPLQMSVKEASTARLERPPRFAGA